MLGELFFAESAASASADAFLASAAALIVGMAGLSAFLRNMDPGGRSLGPSLRLKAPIFTGALDAESVPLVLEASGGDWSLMKDSPYLSDCNRDGSVCVCVCVCECVLVSYIPQV